MNREEFLRTKSLRFGELYATSSDEPIILTEHTPRLVSLVDSQVELIKTGNGCGDGSKSVYFQPFLYVDSGHTDSLGFTVMELIKLPDEIQEQITEFMQYQFEQYDTRNRKSN